jgi:hypothetical protein
MGKSLESASTAVHWGPEANQKWKTALPGWGVSCPIVVGDRIYVTCYSGYGLNRESPGEQKNLKRHLVCVSRANGKVVWSKVVDPVLPEDPYSGIGVVAHGYASHTPVSDGTHVFVFLGKTGAMAFDRDGKKLWQTPLGTESDPKRWGSASSPILYKNTMIVPATAESESLVALNKKTGKIVWKQEALGFANSWSTPILVKVDDKRTDLVIGASAEIWGLNPDTGKMRWYCEGIKNEGFYTSVIHHQGVLYAVEGRNGGSIALRTGGKGNITESHVLWTGRETNRFGTPLIHDGRLYFVSNGIATSLNAKTGERESRVRLTGGIGGSGGRMAGDYASPVFADGKIYFVRQSGDMFVLKPGENMEQLAVNRVTLDNEIFSATPAVAGGDLFFRSNKHLYCVSNMGQTPKPLPEDRVAAAADDGGGGERGGRGGRGGRGRGGRGFDPEQLFKEMDTNADGKLSGDELSGRMRDRLPEADKDKDGSLTLDEFRDGMGRRGRGGRGGGRGGRGGNSREGKPERPKRPAMES